MSTNTCPLCKRKVPDYANTCPSCGYPYKFMVAIQKHDEHEQTEIFFEAIRNHDKYAAIKAIGVLEYLKIKGIDLLYALIDIEDGNYDFALKKIKICLDREKYGSYAYVFCLEKMLECYALQGDIIRTQDLIIKNKDVYKDFWKSYYYIILAKKNSSKNQYQDYLKRGVDNQLNDIDILYNLTYKGNNKAENDIKDILVETFIKFVELHHKVIDIMRVTEHRNDNSISAHFQATVYYNLLEYSDKLFGENNALLPFLNEIFLAFKTESTDAEAYYKAVNRSAVKIRQYLFAGREETPDQILNYIYYLLQIHAFGKAQRKMARENEIIYSELMDNNYKAINLVTEFDILGFIKDERFGKLYEYRKYILSNDTDYRLQVVEKRLFRKLSPRGAYAFQVAEWMFNKTQEEDYSWKDAGPIALNYFRIIELELNQRMIIPLLKDGKYKEISKVFKNERQSLDEDGTEVLQKRFGVIMSSLKQISSSRSSMDGLELGGLLYFINNINIKENAPYEAGDETGCYIFEEVKKLLTEKGKFAFESGEMADMISNEKRERYRNPPAHTRYLPYSIACECRIYVINSIYKVSEWFSS